jgi:hypothetical protein
MDMLPGVALSAVAGAGAVLPDTGVERFSEFPHPNELQAAIVNA